MGEHSRRETILNLNQIVAYLLEAESLKKPRESSSSVDQTLAISGGGGIVENHGNKKKSQNEGRRTCYLCDEEDYMMKDYPSMKTTRGVFSVLFMNGS
jgi:hypothetical protein